MGILVARQPIFDRSLHVCGYEILCRPGIRADSDSGQRDHASKRVIVNTFLLLGLDRVTSGKKAFINFTQRLLLDGIGFNLPKDLIVIEILEDVIPDKDLIQVCTKLQAAGYMLALDDFVLANDGLKPFLKMVDILKVDFRENSDREKRVIAENLRGTKIKLLAEKVETRAEFNIGLEAGYEYFQGFFFQKPEIIPGRDIPGYKLNNLKVLQEVNREDIQYDALAETISRDVSLSYKLLNYINSAYFGMRQQVQSVRHAIMLLGNKEIRKWVSLVLLMGLGADKPEELLVTSLIRANLCESLAKCLRLKGWESELYMLGLLSLIDVIVGRPLIEIIRDLPLSRDIKVALGGERNKYKDILDMVLNYERANWIALQKDLDQEDIKFDDVSQIYLGSIERAQEGLGFAGR
jgi:EAL and modified HD-GYP domain-containing signal transduction protein